MACKVKAKHGSLAFRFYWNGREFWQTTGWRDTAGNRKKAEGWAQQITEEIKAGTFNYLKHFPKGNKAHEFGAPCNKPVEMKPLTVRKFYEEWIRTKKPPFVRLSLQRDYQQQFKKNILPFMGDLELNAVSVETLESFRIHLVNDRGLSLKTARNIMNGSLRAMFRDAGRRIERNPLNELPKNWWPRMPQKEPDPYSEQERDAILNYYRANRPYWAYAFVLFRFWTGTRPSECTALKWGSVDLSNGKAMFCFPGTWAKRTRQRQEQAGAPWRCFRM